MQTLSLPPGYLQLRVTTPRRQQQTNTTTMLISDELGKLEPTCLVSKDGGRINFKGSGNSKSETCTKPGATTRRSGSKRRGLRRFCGLQKTGSGRRIGVEPKDLKQGGGRGSKEEPTTEPSAELMDLIKTKTTLDTGLVAPRSKKGGSSCKALLLGPEGTAAAAIRNVVHNLASLANKEVDKRTQSACAIQAICRGYLGRINFKIRHLMKRLKDIEERKRTELQHIETRKESEMRYYHASIVAVPKRQDEEWTNNSEIIAKLLPEVRDARETNTRLKNELVILKETNRCLAIKNTSCLTAAAKCERKVNCVERCGLQLQVIAHVYNQCLKSMESEAITQVDESVGSSEEVNESPPCRLSEIKEMIRLAEKEDDLL